MAVPPKWVVKNKRTGYITLVTGGYAVMHSAPSPEQREAGWFEDANQQFAASAKCAMQGGWRDMAEAWAKGHGCPECPTLDLCDDERCPRMSRGRAGQ